MRSILITGCNRGLGLGLVKQLVKTKFSPKYVIATCRNIENAKALLPVLKTAAANNADGALGSKKAAVINMTSILGSIAQNNDGGLYPYRCSKASINMATKSLSIDLIKDGILATCVHPGWVKTDMGGNGAPMTIDSSCCSLVQFVENLSEKHNGGFFQWDGKQLEW
ncbi:unnamed protein product [Ceutorhynchus assimilis]|uniref:C-factor n=1 Tax=Ceutorhynchus assimilis TaxID=467358 RepID=A0A9N9MA55_9CUCU|nr:unnamed protein product [Ceutorhynchus assimilis]